MFRIKKLVLQNFGAYFGKHEIVFPDSNGVCIVWGENGYGKTTITNAFRYVLWDTIYGRKHVIRAPRSFVNTDAVGEDMLVELVLNVDGETYTITRGLRYSGSDSNTYQNIFSIDHKGTLLGPDEAAEWLNNLLPFEISRFYVFDGELLDEYEDLLEEGSVSGERLKESIEDILGIPVLINARENLKTLVSEADKEVQQEASKSRETKHWADSLAEANEAKRQLNDSKKDLERQLVERKDESKGIQEKLKNNTKLSKLLGIKESLESSIIKIEGGIEEKVEKIKDTIDSLWENEISLIVSSLIDKERNETEELWDAKKKSTHFEYVSDFISSHIHEDDHHCPICKSAQSPDYLRNILAEFERYKSGLLSEDDEKKLSIAQDKIAALSSISKEYVDYSYIKELIDDVREDEAELAVNNNELNDIYRQIKDYGGDDPDLEDEISSLPGKLKDVLQIIEEIKKGLTENEEKQEIADKAIANCNANIKKFSGDTKTTHATARRDFVNELYLTFDESIASFRERIKANVEKDATDSFVKICHQEEFKSLKINDNFGLQIVKEDGSFVPNRSSGYEQVVAIALISALHKNAPIAGPVFLDSTFQRVDMKHKIRTLQNLSYLSDQIIILAYPQEIGNEDEVRRVLGSQLKKEITIKQITNSKSYFD